MLTSNLAQRGHDDLATIGRTLNDLRGIRFDEGEGGAAPVVPVQPVAPVPTAPVVTPTAPVAPVVPATAPTAEKVEDLPDWAQKIIRDTRDEAAKHRTGATAAATKAQQDLTDKIAVALGLKPDAATDPAALTALAEKAQASARESTIKLAVYQAAGAQSGNPDALLDSSSFLAKVNTLDPTAADFGTQVGEAIKAAIAANPSLKTTRAVGASTVETPGGTGEQGQISEAQLAQMTPEQISDAYEKGQLSHLLS